MCLAIYLADTEFEPYSNGEDPSVWHHVTAATQEMEEFCLFVFFVCLFWYCFVWMRPQLRAERHIFSLREINLFLFCSLNYSFRFISFGMGILLWFCFVSFVFNCESPETPLQDQNRPHTIQCQFIYIFLICIFIFSLFQLG